MTSKQHVLIVEDDPVFRSLLEESLTCEGYDVTSVADGRAALLRFQSLMPNLVILDLTLPDIDGLELCRRLRATRQVPIIILSARSQKVDKIKGFDFGADDYVTKPTDLGELLARIRAVLRRSHATPPRLKIGRLVIDFRTRRAMSGNRTVSLTYYEFKLVQYLAERRGQVVLRDELLSAVWGLTAPGIASRAVDQIIFRLRRKVEPHPHASAFIVTARGDGYCLTGAEEVAE